MKTIIKNGRKFTLSNGKKYHYNSSLRKHLHRYVWEQHNGEIPKGYEIHHVDFNTLNNDIENLQMVTIKEHKEIHRNNISQERLEFMRNNLIENARPKASEWHGSSNGLEWHKKHYKEHKENFHKKDNLICKCCGKEFYGIVRNENRFCSNKCKSKFRRDNGLDNIKRICITCGKEFEINKYSKTVNCSKSCSSTMKWNIRKLKDSPTLQE